MKRSLDSGDEISGATSLNRHRKMNNDRMSFLQNATTNTCDNTNLLEAKNNIDRTQLTKCNVSKKLVIKNFGSYSVWNCLFVCLHFSTLVCLYSQAPTFRRFSASNMGETSRGCHFNSKLQTGRHFTRRTVSSGPEFVLKPNGIDGLHEA